MLHAECEEKGKEKAGRKTTKMQSLPQLALSQPLKTSILLKVKM
jgi:hypothetical protein